ncbi:MAG TPA: hypothetical protein VJL29_08330 [Thermoguttaceae bacterium]|nr:hypothetical protein [Thermoguttaceae bacterium]
MAKMVIVQSQQMWEHMCITRKTADYLIAELNEVGKLGWELVSATYHKEVKTSLGEAFCWTAILKRPLILPSHAAPGESGEATVHDASVQSETGLTAQENDSSIFDLQPEEQGSGVGGNGLS